MINYSATHQPIQIASILQESDRIGFTMNADHQVGSLLRSLIASKPGGNFLELGTGTGVALTWMLDGMDQESSITSIDNDPIALQVAQQHLGADPRLQLVERDAEQWIKSFSGPQFDLIFADTWAGKYHTLPETFNLLKRGGIWVIDDMLERENWPDGHAQRANDLMESLRNEKDLILTSLPWASGVIMAVKR